ncbi:hypothetical protein XPA_006915 [Xanthoria parietina]
MNSQGGLEKSTNTQHPGSPNPSAPGNAQQNTQSNRNGRRPRTDSLADAPPERSQKIARLETPPSDSLSGEKAPEIGCINCLKICTLFPGHKCHKPELPFNPEGPCSLCMMTNRPCLMPDPKHEEFQSLLSKLRIARDAYRHSPDQENLRQLESRQQEVNKATLSKAPNSRIKPVDEKALEAYVIRIVFH